MKEYPVRWITDQLAVGYVQAEEDSLIKDILAQTESKDSLYYDVEL